MYLEFTARDLDIPELIDICLYVFLSLGVGGEIQEGIVALKQI
jgi:hypothetical protein